MQRYVSGPPDWPLKRTFNTLVALICDLGGGQSAHLSTIADYTPTGGATQESLIMRFRRWLKLDAQTLDGWFLPVAKALLNAWPNNRCPWRLTAASSDAAASP